MFNVISVSTTTILVLLLITTSPSSPSFVSANTNPECVPVEEFTHIGKTLLNLNDMSKNDIYFCGPDAPADLRCDCPTVFQCNDFTIHWGNIGTCGCCPPWIIGLIVMLFLAIFVSLIVAIYLCMCRGTWWCDGQQQAPSIVLPMRSAPVRVPEGANVGTNIFRGYRPGEFDTGRGPMLGMMNQNQQQNNNNNNNNEERQPLIDQNNDQGGENGAGAGGSTTRRRRNGERRSNRSGTTAEPLTSDSRSSTGNGSSPQLQQHSTIMSPPPPGNQTVPYQDMQPRPQHMPSFNLMSPPQNNNNAAANTSRPHAPSSQQQPQPRHGTPHTTSPTHIDVQPATERSLSGTQNSAADSSINLNSNQNRRVASSAAAASSGNNNNRRFSNMVSDDDATEMADSHNRGGGGQEESDFFVQSANSVDGRFSQRNGSSHDHPMDHHQQTTRAINQQLRQHQNNAKAELEISDAEDASDILPPGTNNNNIRRLVASSSAAANNNTKNPLPPFGDGSKNRPSRK